MQRVYSRVAAVERVEIVGRSQLNALLYQFEDAAGASGESRWTG